MNRRGLGTKYDGSRQIHYFSQSLLNTFQTCPEQARHELLGDVPRIESPKMALGTAGHAAIEATLRAIQDDKNFTFDDAADLMVSTFEDRTYLAEYQPDETLDIEWAKRRGVSALSNWWDDVRPQVDPLFIEQPFEYLLWSDAQRQIYMKGTIDCVDTKRAIWDWKVSGSERKAWKDQRGSVQAATYTLGLAKRGRMAGVVPDTTMNFKYAVMHEKGVQIVDLQQTLKHWFWLQEQALSLAYLVEANLPKWPVVDDDWHCNVNWCPVFASKQCKGAYFPEGFGAARKGN